MCFKLGMCFGGEDYYRATKDPSDNKGYTTPYTAAADETGRKTNYDVARKDGHAITTAAATRDVHGRATAYPQEKASHAYSPADEPSPKPRSNKVADDTAVKQPAAAAAPAAILRYSDHVY